MCRMGVAIAVFWLPLVVGAGAFAASDPDKGARASAQGDKSECAVDIRAGRQARTAAGNVSQPAAAGVPKVVFQINQAADAPSILRFVTNYLKVEPAAEVAVVGYGGGVDFMLKGAMDAAGKPYADQLQALADRGVAFRVCGNTLKARNLTPDAVAPGVTVVPGAVNEIIRLQTREGYAYFRH